MDTGWGAYGDNDNDDEYDNDTDQVKDCSECNMEFDGSCPMNSSDCPFAFEGEEPPSLFDEEEDDDDDMNDFEDVEDIDSLLAPDEAAEAAILAAEDIPAEDLRDDDDLIEEEESDDENEETESVDEEEDDDYLFKKRDDADGK